MDTLTLWDRIWQATWGWLRHPLSTAAATIAFRYVENHPDLEIRFAEHVRSGH